MGRRRRRRRRSRRRRRRKRRRTRRRTRRRRTVAVGGIYYRWQKQIIYYCVLSRVVPTCPSVKDRPKAKFTAGR